MDRLDVILGIRPPQKDLPFAELNALYGHILAGVEDMEPVLEILSVLLVFFSSPNIPTRWGSPQIEEFLSLQPGDVELYLGNLSSLVNVGPNQGIYVLHAFLTDFLMDPTRSKELWINPRTRHAAFARRYLQSLQLKGKQRFFCHFILHA